MGDKMFDEWLAENVEEFKAYYENRQEEHSSCIRKLLFSKSDKPIDDFNNCIEEPEMLKNIGQFNPELYFLILQDDRDVILFKEIESIAIGTKLVLFTAALGQVYEIVQSTKSLSKSAASLTKSAIKINTKIFTKSETASRAEKTFDIAEAGFGLKKLYKTTKKKINKNLNSSLVVLADAALKLPEGLKYKIMDKIEYRIRELQQGQPLWYTNQRNKVVLKFWQHYLKMIKGGKISVFK